MGLLRAVRGSLCIKTAPGRRPTRGRPAGAVLIHTVTSKVRAPLDPGTETRAWTGRRSARSRYRNFASARLARAREVLRDLLPVHDVPPGLDIVGPLVLVLQVVGVLPHVEAQQGRVPLHERAVLVGRRI